MSDKTERILERFYRRYNKYNTKVLKKLGDIVKQFENIPEEQIYELAEDLKLDINSLIKQLETINIQTIKDMNVLYDNIGKTSLDDAEIYFLSQGIKYFDYTKNKEVRKIVREGKKEIKQVMVDLSNSSNIGFVTKVGDRLVYKNLTKTYNDLIDKAVYEITTGKTDYNSAMRNTIKQLAKSGVKVHQDTILYKNGYNQRIDSAVRRNIFDGMRQVNMAIQQEVAKQFGADGWEIDWHVPCAPDHEDIQGKQYTNEEFIELNNELVRPIGQLNCTHEAKPIKIGINEPMYDNKTLEDAKKQSHEKFEYEGKTYTKYEASQVQRRLETAIRKQKDMNIIAKASNDTQLVDKTKQKISQLTDKYNEFSKKAGLETQKQRLTVSGYRR